jgi:major capsid protein gp7
MATLADTHPTLLDLKNTMDPKGNIAQIVEILNETNEVLDDMVFIEGNLPTGHQTTVRAGIPTPTWRKLYGGVQPTKSRSVKVTDAIGMLEAYAEVDVALAKLNGNSAAFRMSEDRGQIEGMSQEVADTLIYGNEGTEPEAFTGFAPRFNSLAAANADNIIVGGGAGSDNQSVWLVVWGSGTVHGIYPKGSQAGLSVQDKGQVTIEDVDGSGGRMEAYRTHYKWDVGLSVRDWRYIVRIANIDNSDLTKDAASGADLIDLMVQALELIPNLRAGRPAFYVSRRVRSFLRRQMVNKVKSAALSLDQVAGRHVLHFDGVPVRRCDALTASEATVA